MWLGYRIGYWVREYEFEVYYFNGLQFIPLFYPLLLSH
jgi:hypothetical protein